MAVTLTPETLRRYIKDTPVFNKIFAGFEFEPEDYVSAVEWGDAKQEGIPPFMDGFTANDLPVDIRRIGALAALFEMAYLLDIRNMSNLSEKGVPVPVGENALVYERLANKYETMFTEKTGAFKIAYNMNNAIRKQSSIYESYKAPVEGDY